MISLPDDLLARLDEQAGRRGTSRSGLLRELATRELLTDSADRHHTAARQLLEAAAAGTATLAALDLILYEVANVAIVRWRSEEDAERLVGLVTLARPTTLERADEGLLRTAAELAIRHRLTVYEGAYVAAADRHGWTLVSADLRDLVAPGLAISPTSNIAAVPASPAQDHAPRPIGERPDGISRTRTGAGG